MNTQDKIDRGRVAQDYAGVIEEKIKLIEQEFVTGLRELNFNDDQGRYNMVMALHICEKVLEYLKSDVRDAEYAKKQLEDMAKTGHRTLKDKVINLIP